MRDIIKDSADMNRTKINTLIRDNVKAMQPYASARDEFKDMTADMIFLDANENPFDSDINRYPDPQQLKLKSIISRLKNVPQNQILLGNGSDEVLDLIFRVFCEPRVDNIITLPPTYGMYEVLANLNAVDILKIELNDQFEPRVKTILKTQNAQSKLLFLCIPNNPTANSFKSEKIEKLLLGFNGVVVIDEAYIDFSINQSWINRLIEFPNLIVTQTLSKAYGMAGIRLGICYASAEIIAVLNRIKPPYNINQLTQLKALERLSKPKVVSEEITKILQQREWMRSELESISFVETVFFSDANFLLIKVDDANQRYAQLIKNGIVVRNRTNEKHCKNCLRITIGTKSENLKLIKTLTNL